VNCLKTHAECFVLIEASSESKKLVAQRLARREQSIHRARSFAGR